MSRRRLSFRIFLATLALGLTASRIVGYFAEIRIDLPRTNSGTIVITPTSEGFPLWAGGGGSGREQGLGSSHCCATYPCDKLDYLFAEPSEADRSNGEDVRAASSNSKQKRHHH